jgi:hypothetical protein
VRVPMLHRTPLDSCRRFLLNLETRRRSERWCEFSGVHKIHGWYHVRARGGRPADRLVDHEVVANQSHLLSKIYFLLWLMCVHTPIAQKAYFKMPKKFQKKTSRCTSIHFMFTQKFSENTVNFVACVKLTILSAPKLIYT